MTEHELHHFIKHEKYNLAVEGLLAGKANPDPFISNQYTNDKLLRRIVTMLYSDIKRAENNCEQAEELARNS